MIAFSILLLGSTTVGVLPALECTGCEANVDFTGGPGAGQGSWTLAEHEGNGTCAPAGQNCVPSIQCDATATINYSPPVGGAAGYSYDGGGVTWFPANQSISPTLNLLQCNLDKSMTIWLNDPAAGGIVSIGQAIASCEKCEWR